MNDEHWENLKINLGKKFEVVEDKTEDLLVDTPEGAVKQGEQNVLVVRTPLGKIKLVREIRPKILEKKYHYTHRQGAAAQTEYKFSDTEKTYKLRLFKQDELGDWEELNEESLQGVV